jgi:hypothetical protein
MSGLFFTGKIAAGCMLFLIILLRSVHSVLETFEFPSKMPMLYCHCKQHYARRQ